MTETTCFMPVKCWKFRLGRDYIRWWKTICTSQPFFTWFPHFQWHRQTTVHKLDQYKTFLSYVYQGCIY